MNRDHVGPLTFGPGSTWPTLTAASTDETASVLAAMSNHDANEERRYLREGRLNVAWSWMWLSWLFGVGGDLAPGADERWSVYVSLGPIAVEVYWRNGGAA